MHVRTMAKAECVKVLAGNRLVRLACVHDGRPYIVPIHVVREESHFYAFSMPGQKIEWMRRNPEGRAQAVAEAQRRFADGRWRTDVTAIVPFEEAMERVPAELAKPNGKVFIEI